ncbi:MAG: DUF5107 domain-containing protein [Bacteroidales bacterium]
MHFYFFKILVPVVLLGVAATRTASSQVAVTEKKLTIPTYLAADPDPNPVFFNGRRYQGAQGRVYPYPLTYNLTDSLTDVDYDAVLIENEYIEICILPELGGRIYYAKDKSNDYNFIYHNSVIKPALIGMTGAWISGGVEWNIPHHHRASSFYPVEHAVTEKDDGSKTVWVGETELRHRSKWIVGITLHPGSTLVETTVRVLNTTPFQNSILAWANVAVHANEDYQVFFPPRTQYTTYHRKNQFSEWPVSHQHYNGADYTRGVDVSRWENHIKPTSFFEWGNTGNFVAGIDHGAEAGTVIFGDKYVNPGKKLWSWGNNPTGAMWDRLLTDEDGPYVELMFGSFSDNQPDYSWIQTLETKESRYWFAPVKGMKGVKMVNRNAIIDLDVRGDSLFAAINVTSIRKSAVISLYNGTDAIFESVTDLSPDTLFIIETDLLSYEPDAGPGAVSDRVAGAGSDAVADDDIRIVLQDSLGIIIAEYGIEKPANDPVPEPVSLPLSAEEINDPDSLYYAGLHFEQFHDPYYMPLDYYLKALSINPRHVPSLTRTGMLYLKAGDNESAAGYLETAVERVSSDYTVAENAAPLYYLGLAYNRLGRESDAYSLFYRASWDYSFNSPARYHLALTDSRRGNYYRAVNHLRQAYSTSTRSTDILSLKISMYRLTGDIERALEIVESILELDPLNLRACYERYLILGSRQSQQEFTGIMRNYHENYLELAVDYGNAGLYNDALNILALYNELPEQSIENYPSVFYLMGYYNHLSGNTDRAREFFSRASEYDHNYSFPFRFETAAALETALEYDPYDALAWYLTGNIYYDHQPVKAIKAWKKSVDITDDIPVAYRNIAFASANISNDPEEAVENIKKAITLKPDDPRYYYEYDLYLKTLLTDPEKRLEPFVNNHEVVVSDQITIFPYAELLTVTGNHDQAVALMRDRHFHRWEGGESIYHYWLYAHLFKAEKAYESNLMEEADSLIDSALSYPLNLQSVYSDHEPVAWYYKGLVAENMNQTAEADSFFMKAVRCTSGAPECDYFAARAYEKMKKGIATQSIFEAMIKTGREELLAEDDMDFFDPFARVKSKHEIQANACLRIALGYHGLGDVRNAGKYYNLAKEHNPAIMSLVFRD